MKSNAEIAKEQAATHLDELADSMRKLAKKIRRPGSENDSLHVIHGSYIFLFMSAATDSWNHAMSKILEMNPNDKNYREKIGGLFLGVDPLMRKCLEDIFKMIEEY